MALKGWAAAAALAAGVAGPAGAEGGRSAPTAGRGGDGRVQEAAGAGAGGRVVRVEVFADARTVGAARVSMRYRLEVDPQTDAVPFTLLLFAPTTVGEIVARAGGETLSVRAPGDGGPRLEGEIELPAAGRASGRVSLELDYRLENAVRASGAEVRIALPMLAVDWAPAEAAPGTFRAEVALPPGTEAREIFPTTPAGGAEPGIARASLQVLPAAVRVRALPAGRFGVPLPTALELLVLAAVIGCGMAGLRFVRRAR